MLQLLHEKERDAYLSKSKDLKQSQSVFTCSEFTIQTQEQGVKYVQS